MKLTKTQESVLNEMKEALNKIKPYPTFEEYFETVVRPMHWENWEFSEREMQIHKNNYLNAKKNIVSKRANTKTFEKLVALGLIEVVEYRENQLDLIKILN